MLLLLAQKENRKEMGLGDCNRDRKDDPHLWKEDHAMFQ